MNLAQTHQSLKNSQSRFLALFEQSPLSMLLFSPQGYIRVANQAFETLFSVGVHDLIASNFNMMEHEKVKSSEIFEYIIKGFTHHFVELPKTPFFSSGDLTIVNHEDCFLRCFIYPIKDELGNIIEVVMMHKDMSEQIRAKDSLIRFNQRLENLVEKRTKRLKALNEELIRSKIREEAAMREKDEFFSNVSHELRTPLTAIKEASSMLFQGIYAHHPEKQHELFIIIKEECDRLILSVDSILDVAKIQSGMRSCCFQTLDIPPLLQKTLMNLEPIAGKKRIRMEFLCKSDIPRVRMDEEKIGRVLINLIGNALKFTPENGHITVSAVKDEKESFVTISVRDTGCGIHSKDLDIIFDKFIRLRQTNNKTKGSGLGLFIARNIIADHKGKLWAESQPGKGSSFFFTLPAAG